MKALFKKPNKKEIILDIPKSVKPKERYDWVNSHAYCTPNTIAIIANNVTECRSILKNYL
jgi:hypothetical protein